MTESLPEKIYLNKPPTISNNSFRVVECEDCCYELFVRPTYYRVDTWKVWVGLFKRIEIVQYNEVSGPFLPVVERFSRSFYEQRIKRLSENPLDNPYKFKCKSDVESFKKNYKGNPWDIEDVQKV